MQLLDENFTQDQVRRVKLVLHDLTERERKTMAGILNIVLKMDRESHERILTAFAEIREIVSEGHATQQ